MIVVTVEHELERVAFDILVAPGELRLNLSRVLVEEAHADVDRGVVDEESSLGLLRRWLALVRVELPEFRDWGCRLPRGLVELAVDVNFTDPSHSGGGRRLLVGAGGGYGRWRRRLLRGQPASKRREERRQEQNRDS